MRTLIFGGSGFCGSHLAQLCEKAGEEVFVTGRQKRPVLASSASFLKVDINEPSSIEEALIKSRPDRIYHLAGFASVRESFHHQEEAYRTNVLGTYHVLSGIKKRSPEARVLVVGSAEEYGPIDPENLPIKESTPLRPLSPYGVSRVGSTLMSLRESDRHSPAGLCLVATRTFNLTGPGQSDSYVCSDFAKQMARASLKGQSEIVLRVGNLSAKRDFSSVVDGMNAYRSLIEKGRSGHVYNVCSGRSIAISEIVGILGEISGLKICIEIDKKRFRSVEVPEVRGDPGKLVKETGERPGSLESSLTSLFLSWRRHLEENKC
ncbi:MAG: GDP-mannose 4,6-dehydratase [Planctomycetota bacterium]|nr:GDP-mannose 4,6-dehydratase [Planctomycetota bacterium]